MPRKYQFETDLCDDFLAKVDRAYWQVYPEQNGFDIFMVRDDAMQLGIQAKLRFTTEVLDQALPSIRWKKSPDFRAVLVPRETSHNWSLCTKIKLGLLHEDSVLSRGYHGCLQEELRWHTDPEKRLAVPEYVANIKPGSPCPPFLSAWKIAAIQFSWAIRERQEIAAKEFRAHGQSPQLWESKGWAKRIRHGVYSLGDNPLPHVCYAGEGHHVLESLKEAS